MTPLPDPTLIAEHAVLARALGTAQRRFTAEAAAAEARIAALQRELAQMRSERTQMLALLGRLAQALPAAPRRRGGRTPDAEPVATHAAWVEADRLICQTGCRSDGAPWRVEDRCRRSGVRCVFGSATAPATANLATPVAPDDLGDRRP